MFDLALRNARVHGEPADVHVHGGRIAALGAERHEAARTLDLGGRAVLPGLVEAHCHLDKTLTIGRVGNDSGTLLEAIRNWVAFKPQLSKRDYLERGARALEMAMLAGTTALRTHVDVDGSSFTALEAILELRDTFRDRITVQIVALGSPADEPEVMREAMRLGADAVGGCPAIREDGALEVRRALEIAEAFGKPVDLHVDENDETNFLGVLADAVLERGFALPVMAGHCCSLDFMDEDTAARVVDRVARAGISVVSLPACNLNLQGRGVHPMPRGVTRVRQLLEAGVNVAFASDNVQDPFHPVGNYDLLFAANLGALAAHMTHADGLRAAFEMVTANAARALGLEAPGLRVGAPADLVVVDAADALEAVRLIGRRHLRLSHLERQGEPGGAPWTS